MEQANARIMRLASEYAERAKEALRIYRPTPKQLVFHESLASERIIRGGKRSGKTIAASAEFASAVTGMPIIRADGTKIPRNYPKHDMLAWVTGYDLRHIGGVIYPKLFLPGYFRILPDGAGKWRMLDPANPEDEARIDESVPVGPMIPPRYIDQKSWAWESKAERIFKSVTVRNPWGQVRIEAFPSTAIQPPQGASVNLIWIDEDIRFPHHVSEYQDRMSDAKGRLIWSAWPHGANDALVEMSARAEEQEDSDNPDVMEVVLRFSDNPYISSEEKRKAVGRMGTEEERRSRDYGEFLFDTISMYDFVPAYHGIFRIIDDDPYTQRYKDDKLSQIWTKLGTFPDEWTRYLAIDPSHTRSAVLFGVVPPKDLLGKNVLIIEDELVMKKASANDLAKGIKDKIRGRQYEAFIIDHNASRQTSIGQAVGNTTLSLYERAFKAHGVKSASTGYSCYPGNNRVNVRTMEVRSLLQGDEDGFIGLRFVIDKTYITQKEFGRYKKKIVGGEVTDEPANARKMDCMSALEYLVSHFYHLDSPFVQHQEASDLGAVYRRAQRMKKRMQLDDNVCHIGAGNLP